MKVNTVPIFPDFFLHCINKHAFWYIVRVRNMYIFSYFSTKTYVVGTQKNCLNETDLYILNLFFNTRVIQKVLTMTP